MQRQGMLLMQYGQLGINSHPKLFKYRIFTTNRRCLLCTCTCVSVRARGRSKPRSCSLIVSRSATMCSAPSSPTNGFMYVVFMLNVPLLSTKLCTSCGQELGWYSCGIG